MLEFFCISKSTYFYNVKNYNFPKKDVDLENKITEIFNYHKSRYGYRRITLSLKNENILVNHKKVKRIMKELGLFAKKPKAKYKSYKGELSKTAKNHLLVKKIDTEKHTTYYERDFTTQGLNHVWGTDVSEFHIASGKLYLSPIIDFNNREVISYNISKVPNYTQIEDMLDKAF